MKLKMLFLLAVWIVLFSTNVYAQGGRGVNLNTVIDSISVKNSSLSVNDIANGANGFLPKIQTVYTINADTTIGADQSGTLFVLRPLTAKRTLTLPGAVAGLEFDFLIADTDSLRIMTATGDSLITSAGVASKTATSVAGTIRLVAMDTVRWIMLYTLGTWTSY